MCCALSREGPCRPPDMAARLKGVNLGAVVAPPALAAPPPPPPSLAPVPVLIIRDSAAGAGLEPLPTEDTGVSEGWERRRLVLKGLALAAAEVDGFSLGLGSVPGVGYSLGLGAVAGVSAICRLVAGVAAIVLVVAVAVAGVAATGLVAPVPGVEPRPPPPTPNVVSAALAFGTGSAFHQ